MYDDTNPDAPLSIELTSVGETIANLREQVADLERKLERAKAESTEIYQQLNAKSADVEAGKEMLAQMVIEHSIVAEDAKRLAEAFNIDLTYSFRIKGEYLVDIEVDAFARQLSSDDLERIITRAIENALDDEDDIEVLWSEASAAIEEN